MEEFEEEEGEDDAFVTSILEENNLLLDEIHQLKCAVSILLLVLAFRTDGSISYGMLE